MKKKKSNQPTEYVRKSNEEILESAKQAMYERGSGDSEVNEIMLKLFTYTPEEGLADKVAEEIIALGYSRYYTKKFGV